MVLYHRLLMNRQRCCNGNVVVPCVMFAYLLKDGGFSFASKFYGEVMIVFDDDDSGLGFFCFLLVLPLLIEWYFKLTFLLLELVCRALGLVIMGICYFVKFVFEILSVAYHKISNYVSAGSE